MNGEDEGSCRQSLDVHFFGPAGIAAEQVCFFDGKNTNGEAECKKVEDFIAANGGIDLVVLGLGLNGHVGMNEPGTRPIFVRMFQYSIHKQHKPAKNILPGPRRSPPA